MSAAQSLPVRPPGHLSGHLSGHLPGHLAENVMHFARVLRAAGMPVGTDRVQTALQALQVAGLASRNDFHATLAACLVDRAEHRGLFDQAFQRFWHGPDPEASAHALPLPKAQEDDDTRPPAEDQRPAGALLQQPPPPAQPPPMAGPELDAQPIWSDRERLRKADFDAMTAEEWQLARCLLAQMRLVFDPVPTRRTQRARQPGRADWRATLAVMARHGGELWDMRWRRPRTRPAPIVLLADISGSMRRYSRMLLQFGHALEHADARVESFVFGTRLTRTTRLLRSRDPDLAMRQVVAAVPDWSGGTRITACLHEFNRRWARRVLGSQATVLLVTDGLEHGDTAALAFEMDRLHKSCRRLLWLNPLLRFDGFEPRAAGIRAMLPHVDRFLPAHNLDSLHRLVQLLGADAALSFRA